MCELNLTQDERKMIILGLQMRRNYIETGDCNTSAADAERMESLRDGTYKRQHDVSAKVKALSVDQMKLIVATEELISKLYKTGFNFRPTASF